LEYGPYQKPPLLTTKYQGSPSFLDFYLSKKNFFNFIHALFVLLNELNTLKSVAVASYDVPKFLQDFSKTL